jgi:non-haem Fe2+, alpha-ketoglutarate-dependent halogenase
MKFIAGTHQQQVQHADTFDQNNLLTRGQEIAVEVDEAKAVHVELKPGQASLHHVLLFHGSEPNRSDDRRIGLAVRYIPTRLKQAIGQRDWATLVRGKDDYRHFEPNMCPGATSSPRRSRSTRWYRKNRCACSIAAPARAPIAPDRLYAESRHARACPTAVRLM